MKRPIAPAIAIICGPWGASHELNDVLKSRPRGTARRPCVHSVITACQGLRNAVMSRMAKLIICRVRARILSGLEDAGRNRVLQASARDYSHD